MSPGILQTETQQRRFGERADVPGVAAGWQTVAPKLLLGPQGEGSTHQCQLQKQFLRENRLPGFRHSFKVGVEETLFSFPLAQTLTIVLSSGTIFCN